MKKIIVRNAQKSYNGLKALDNISFEIFEREIFGILGPNGAGKTTLIESILGLRKLDYGTAQVFGLNAFSNHQEFVRLVGAQLQEAEMSPIIKVKEAVRLQAGIFGCVINVDEKLNEFDLAQKANSYFSKLSGGEKQKLFILLASIHNPEILFFDELSTGLDPISRRETWNKVLQLKEDGKTVILSTHLMEEAEYICDRVALINQGKIIGIGKTGELIKTLPFSNIIEFESNSSINEIQKYSKSIQVIVRIENPSRRQFTAFLNGSVNVKEITTEFRRRGIEIIKIKSRECNLEDYFTYVVKKSVN